MCGICGIINLNHNPVQQVSIREMMGKMKHRGPDDEGVFTEENVGLGFVRLSIIDLSPAGHQPKISDDQRYVIVFNGEIFNYIELREELILEGISFSTKTDTEVLLKAYIHWGEECMHRFNGMWAFAIYDRTEKSIFAARDRYGVKPFYYINTADCFAFCSEIPPLLTLSQNKPEPDFQSVFDYLIFSRTDQTESTFFKNIKKLQHATKLKIANGKIEISKWYDLRQRVQQTKGFTSADEYRQLFSSAVGLRLRSDVPVGVCLSGGLDSSSIVSVLLKDFKKNDLHTFSAVYSKGQTGDETEFITEYNSQLQNMYFTTPDANTLLGDLDNFIIAHGEPIPSTSPYAQYSVMKLAHKKVVVTLDGQGADEKLAGYHYFFGFFFKDLLRGLKIFRLISEIAAYLKNHRSLFGIKTFVFFLLPAKLRTSLRMDEKGYLNAEFAQKFKGTNTIAGNLYGSESLNDALLDHFEYKLEHLLKWEDRNSMHFSLEARVPFLDFRLVEKTLASSSNWVIRKGMTKYILRQAMRGILPEKIRMRKDKIGFGTPEDEWFRTSEWQKIIFDILKSKTFADRKIINPAEALLQYNRHLKKEINVSKEIWKWVHLELWFRKFID